MKAYTIQASRREGPIKAEVVRQVPTFVLLAGVQGIVDAAHAERVARQILGPTTVAITVIATELQ